MAFACLYWLILNPIISNYSQSCQRTLISGGSQLHDGSPTRTFHILNHLIAGIPCLQPTGLFGKSSDLSKGFSWVGRGFFLKPSRFSFMCFPIINWVCGCGQSAARRFTGYQSTIIKSFYVHLHR